MPQSFALYPDLTARENVDFVASLFGMLWRARHRRTREVLRARRPLGCPGSAGRRAVGRHAATTGARLRPRPRPDPPVPRRADRGYRPAPAGDDLGRAAPPPRRGPDAPRHDPVRQRGRVVRPRGTDLRGPPDRARRARRSCDVRRWAATSSRSRRPSAVRPVDHRDHAGGPARRASRGPNRVRVTVDDAATAMPDVVDAHRRTRRRGDVRSRAPAVVRRGLRDPRRARPRSARFGQGRRRRRGRGGGMMSAPLAVVIRLLAFIGKELVESLRRPGALVSLVFGPFLIMALFGLGYNGERRPLETIVVIPPGSGLPTDVATYQDLAVAASTSQAVTPDRAAAEASLADRAVDVVIVAPVDPEAAFRAGQQSVIDVMIDVVDPIAGQLRGLPGRRPGQRREPLGHRAGRRPRVPAYATDAGESAAAMIPPAVVAAPTTAELVNVAPSNPGVVGVLRAGRLGPDPPAPGGDARRAVARARAYERRDGAVPDRAGELARDPGRQGPRVRDPRERHRGDHGRAAGRRVRCPACWRIRRRSPGRSPSAPGRFARARPG